MNPRALRDHLATAHGEQVGPISVPVLRERHALLHANPEVEHTHPEMAPADVDPEMEG